MSSKECSSIDLTLKLENREPKSEKNSYELPKEEFKFLMKLK